MKKTICELLVKSGVIFRAAGKEKSIRVTPIGVEKSDLQQ